MCEEILSVCSCLKNFVLFKSITTRTNVYQNLSFFKHTADFSPLHSQWDSANQRWLQANGHMTDCHMTETDNDYVILHRWYNAIELYLTTFLLHIWPPLFIMIILQIIIIVKLVLSPKLSLEDDWPYGSSLITSLTLLTLHYVVKHTLLGNSWGLHFIIWDNLGPLCTLSACVWKCTLPVHARLYDHFWQCVVEHQWNIWFNVQEWPNIKPPWSKSSV